MTKPVRGRLLPPGDAPAVGERMEELARVAGVLVEHILSGELGAPVDYNQAHDEWVLVLSGRARLDVGSEHLELTGGDWVMLPAHVPHRLVETEAGTSWLAVHAPGPA